MGRGRPIRSQIRQNIIEILYFVKHGSGYDLYKIYKAIYPKVTIRSIYYNLKKGVELEECVVEKIEKEKGDYSWGSEVEKIYYSLGPNAKPKIDAKVKEYLDSQKKR